MKTKITRQSDGLEHSGKLRFIEWNEYHTGKEVHKEPQIGYSCVIDLSVETFLEFEIPTYKWLTSTITEIISETEFKTKNSTYKIEKI